MNVIVKIVHAGGSMWESAWLLNVLPMKSPTIEQITPHTIPIATPIHKLPVLTADNTAALAAGNAMW